MPRIKTKEEVLANLRSIIEGLNVDITTADHSTVYDVFLSPVSQEIEKLYKLLDYVSKISSYDGLKSLLEMSDDDKIDLSEGFAPKSDGTAYTAAEVEAIISTDIENYASNYNITRDPGTKATGNVRFYRRDNSAMTIPTGTIVSTSGLSPIYFETTTSIVNETPSYDSSKGMYYVTASVRALLPGSDGNVGKTKINVISPPIPDIAITCSNPSDLSGGTDPESDSALLERTRGGWAVSNVNTVEGYINLMKENENVQDAIVIGPTDSEMERQLPGAIDIWVAASENLVAVEQKITYHSSQDEYLLLNPPVTSISSVKKDEDQSIVSSSKYSLSSDTGVNALSTEAQDKISFSETLEDGKVYVITYYYDKIIFDLQSVFDLDANNVVDCDVLVKKGERILIDVVAEFTVFPDQITKEAGIQAINSLLTVFFNGGTYSYATYFSKKFGEDVVSSIVRELILSIRGIDRLETVGWEFKRRGGTHKEQIYIDFNQFARFGQFTSL